MADEKGEQEAQENRGPQSLANQGRGKSEGKLLKMDIS